MSGDRGGQKLKGIDVVAVMERIKTARGVEVSWFVIRIFVFKGKYKGSRTSREVVLLCSIQA